MSHNAHARSMRAGVAAASLALAAAASADPIVALTAPAPLTGTQSLIRFDSATPTIASLGVPLSGLQAGETVLGIDFRPANGELFGLGSTGRLYVINPATGLATQRGTGTFLVELRGENFGFDFNPTVDRIRITSDAGQNLRANPNDGNIVDADPNTPGVQPDGNLAYAVGDVNEGATARVVASGYTNSFFGSTTTTLFNIDAGLDAIVRQMPPNAGTLNTVAMLSIDANELTSLELSPRDNAAFMTGPGVAPPLTGFYELNIETGAATFVGHVGPGPVQIVGIAVEPSMCPCDFNRDYQLNSQDFFDYMNAFWASEARANFNRDAVVNSQDFFDFLSCFFAPPGGCM
jgi:hypothetical protein